MKAKLDIYIYIYVFIYVYVYNDIVICKSIFFFSCNWEIMEQE